MEQFITDLANYLEGKLKSGLDPLIYARGLVKESDLTSGDLEVRAFHTASGNPLPIGFEPAVYSDEGDMISPPKL